MKRFIFGILVTVIGLIFSVFCFVYAAMNPWSYNGVTGLLGSFLGTSTLVPFILSMVVLVVGVAICWYEAYQRK